VNGKLEDRFGDNKNEAGRTGLPPAGIKHGFDRPLESDPSEME
jgi:hypothetical protein